MQGACLVMDTIGLTNDYLQNILEQISLHFVGVNNLTGKLHSLSRFSAVCNTHGHFICILGFSDRLLYIDPFGLAPMDGRITAFLEADLRPCYINRATYQHPLSVYCGFFCVYFILYAERMHKDLHAFDGFLLELNDQICMSNIHTLLHNDIVN